MANFRWNISADLNRFQYSNNQIAPEEKPRAFFVNQIYPLYLVHDSNQWLGRAGNLS